MEGLVEAADGRAAIACHVARRVEPGAAVHLLLHDHQAHDGLRPGDEDAGLRQIVFVVEGDLREGGERGVGRGHDVLQPGLAALLRRGTDLILEYMSAMLTFQWSRVNRLRGAASLLSKN
jgi:hypothetical protein